MKYPEGTFFRKEEAESLVGTTIHHVTSSQKRGTVIGVMDDSDFYQQENFLLDVDFGEQGCIYVDKGDYQQYWSKKP